MVSVSHRPSANQRNQVSYHAGYPYKAGLPVTMEIEKRKFELFTRPEVDNDAAWTPDESVDQAIIAAMRAGKTMTVIGTSARGTKTTDTIPLAGFSRALATILDSNITTFIAAAVLFFSMLIQTARDRSDVTEPPPWVP